MDLAPWRRTPAGWPPVQAQVLEDAIERLLDYLGGPEPELVLTLAEQYDLAVSPRTLLTYLDPSPADHLSPSDLLAVSHLAGVVPTHGLLRMLLHGAYQEEVTSPLRRLPLTDLALAGPSELETMEEAFDGARSGLGDLHAAQVLCAVKRPDVFPLLREETTQYLGLPPAADHRAHWLACRHVIGEPEVVRALDRLLDALARVRLDGYTGLDTVRLRLLDVAVSATTARDLTWPMGRALRSTC